MTKKMTMEEVAQYLIDEISGEWVNGEFGKNEFVYYLWVDDQGQPTTMGRNSSESFSAVLDERAYVDYPDDEDWRDEVETLENEYFLEVVKTIYEDYSDWYETDREKTADEWREILESLNDEELIAVWNDYTEENNDFDSHIFYMSEIDDIFQDRPVFEIVNTLYTGFTSDDHYCQFNGYGHLESFTDPTEYIFIDDIVSAITKGYYDPSNVDYLF